MAKKLMWQVRLGRTEWERFTYARPPGNALRLLGTARRGMQMGALAITPDGQYVHVVGDHTTPLPTILIKKAITRAEAFEKHSSGTQWKAQRTNAVAVPVVAAPVVIVKRRRVAVPA